MKVIIDKREHGLFEKCESILHSMTKTSYVILSKDVLELGDILITTDEDKPVLLIERKSFSDLLASIKDGRYEEQSYRLTHSSGFPGHSVIYVLEGMFSQLKNPIEKKIIYSAMTSLHMFKGFSVFRTTTVQETAEWILYMADKIEREFHKGTFPYYLSGKFRKPVPDSMIPLALENKMVVADATENTENLENVLASLEVAAESDPPTEADYSSVVKKCKKKNVTPNNIGEIILCQIPGISSVTAISIMKKFSGFPNFMVEINANPDCLNNLMVGDGADGSKLRKISKSTIDSIKSYLLAVDAVPVVEAELCG